MWQSPVYVLNHSQHNFRQRTTQADLDEIEDWTDRAARRMYEGAGLGPKDVDIFNPYDGCAPMAGASSSTASNAVMPSRSTGAISGSRDRTSSARVAGAPVRPCTPTA
jgi:hypothetical protein